MATGLTTKNEFLTREVLVEENIEAMKEINTLKAPGHIVRKLLFIIKFGTK